MVFLGEKKKSQTKKVKSKMYGTIKQSKKCCPPKPDKCEKKKPKPCPRPILVQSAITSVSAFVGPETVPILAAGVPVTVTSASIQPVVTFPLNGTPVLTAGAGVILVNSTLLGRPNTVSLYSPGATYTIPVALVGGPVTFSLIYTPNVGTPITLSTGTLATGGTTVTLPSFGPTSVLAPGTLSLQATAAAATEAALTLTGGPLTIVGSVNNSRIIWESTKVRCPKELAKLQAALQTALTTGGLGGGLGGGLAGLDISLIIQALLGGGGLGLSGGLGLNLGGLGGLGLGLGL